MLDRLRVLEMCDKISTAQAWVAEASNDPYERTEADYWYDRSISHSYEAECIVHMLADLGVPWPQDLLAYVRYCLGDPDRFAPFDQGDDGDPDRAAL